MSDDTKIAVVIAITIVLVVGMVIGGVLGNRWIKGQDVQVSGGQFTISVQLPVGYDCWTMDRGDDGQAIFVCER